MNKTAQERGWIDRTIEKYHPGKLLDKQPETYVEKLDELRRVDDEIRGIATGADGSKSLKDLLKLAKQKLNEREYIVAYRNLAEFHEKVYEISKRLNNLSLDFDKAYDEIMVPEDFESEKEYLENISKRFKKSELNNNSIIVTAGIIDWIKDNFGSDRRKTLAYWEKINPKQSGVIKSQTGLLISQSQSLLTKLLSSLKEMSSLRNKRKVYQYGDLAKKFLKDFNIYHTNFEKYHNEYIVPFLKRYQEFSVKEKSSDEGAGAGAGAEAGAGAGAGAEAGAGVQQATPEDIKKDRSGQLNALEIVNQLNSEGYTCDPRYVKYQYRHSMGKNPSPKGQGDYGEIVCPLCGGDGSSWRHHDAPGKKISGKLACSLCVGTGWVSSSEISFDADAAPAPPAPPAAPAAPAAPSSVVQAPQSVAPAPISPPVPPAAVAPPPSPAAPITSVPAVPTVPVSSIDDNPLPLKPPTRRKQTSNNFIETLESLSSESPLILKSIILKQAKQILATDRDTALKLIDIAKRIK